MDAQMKRDDKIKYKSFAGEVYDAVFLSAGPPGFAAIDVLIPGVKEPFTLKAVRLERIGRA